MAIEGAGLGNPNLEKEVQIIRTNRHCQMVKGLRISSKKGEESPEKPSKRIHFIEEKESRVKDSGVELKPAFDLEGG